MELKSKGNTVRQQKVSACLAGVRGDSVELIAIDVHDLLSKDDKQIRAFLEGVARRLKPDGR